MATLVIPDTVQVAIEMTCSGQPVWNIIHLNGGGGFQTAATTLADVKAAWEVAAGPLKLRPSTLTMVGYHFTDLSSTTGAVGFLGSTTAGAGSATLSTMASAALVKLSTGTRSRSQQGRLYHGPLGESDINNDGRTIVGSSATNITAAYNNFRIAIGSGTRTWAVASRKLLVSTPITQISTAGVIATQRRRLR
jgi:hypothetical protein